MISIKNNEKVKKMLFALAYRGNLERIFIFIVSDKYYII